MFWRRFLLGGLLLFASVEAFSAVFPTNFTIASFGPTACVGGESLRCGAIPEKGTDLSWVTLRGESVTSLTSNWNTVCGIIRSNRVACFRFKPKAIDKSLSAVFDAPPKTVAISLNVGQMCFLTEEGEPSCAPIAPKDAPVLAGKPSRLFSSAEDSSFVGMFKADSAICFVGKEKVVCQDMREDDDSQGKKSKQHRFSVGSPKGIAAATAEQSTVCGIGQDGRVRCLGDGFAGQLGVFAIEESKTPAAAMYLQNARRLTAIGETFCAATLEGKVFCWGEKAARLVQIKTKSAIWTPQVVPGLNEIDDVVLTYSSLCSLNRRREVKCTKYSDEFSDPVRAAFANIPANAVAIASDDDERTMCYLRSDGTVGCAGKADYGQTGAGQQVKTENRRVLGLEGAKAIWVPNRYSACAQTEKRDLFCWGAVHSSDVRDGNEYLGATVGHIETDLRQLLGFSLKDEGFYCGIDVEGSLWCWERDKGALAASCLSQKCNEPRRWSTQAETFVSLFAVGSDWKKGAKALCGVSPNGSYRCFGKSRPVETGKLAGMSQVTEVVSSASGLCMKSKEQDVICFPRDEKGLPDSKFFRVKKLPADPSTIGCRNDGCWATYAPSGKVFYWTLNGDDEFEEGLEAEALSKVPPSFSRFVGVWSGVFCGLGKTGMSCLPSY